MFKMIVIYLPSFVNTQKFRTEPFYESPQEDATYMNVKKQVLTEASEREDETTASKEVQKPMSTFFWSFRRKSIPIPSNGSRCDV